jgi:hypothetical protein
VPSSLIGLRIDLLHNEPVEKALCGSVPPP